MESRHRKDDLKLMGHHCHALGCNTPVPPRLHMCRRNTALGYVENKELIDALLDYLSEGEVDAHVPCARV